MSAEDDCSGRKKHPFQLRKREEKKEDDENKCLYCGKKFPKRSGLTTHLRVHEWVRNASPGAVQNDSGRPRITLEQFEAIRNAVGPAKHVLRLPDHGGAPTVKLHLPDEPVAGTSFIIGQKDAIPAAVIARYKNRESATGSIDIKSSVQDDARTCPIKDQSKSSHMRSYPQIRRVQMHLANRRLREKERKEYQDVMEENQNLWNKYQELSARFAGLQAFSKFAVTLHKEQYDSLCRENAILKIAAENAEEANRFL